MPEPRMSADGLYYWDGAQWISTLSPDGRSRWNGTAWVPAGQNLSPTAYHQPQPSLREPTSWTRPLQYAVAGWYAISAVSTLSLPFWMSAPMAAAMNQSIQRQQALYPTATPPPADFTNAMTSMMSGVLWVAAVFGFAISLVVIVGALKRWTWTYYAVLVLLGFSVISLPANLINLVTGTSPGAASGISMPAWTVWIGVIFSIPAAALFVWMLIAIIQRGPWAMKRVSS